jgi:hypothetical protein
MQMIHEQRPIHNESGDPLCQCEECLTLMALASKGDDGEGWAILGIVLIVGAIFLWFVL